MSVYSKFMLILFIVGLFVSILVSSSKPINSEVLVGSDNPAENVVIAGYKHWTRVNPEPQQVMSLIVAQYSNLGRCAAQTAPPEFSMEAQNPHRNKFVVVYVNEIARPAMMEQKLPIFPEGSVIVKEKLATKDSLSPELLTVMRKRESGYDPDKGNWEYMVFDGAGQTLQADGKLENIGAYMKHLHGTWTQGGQKGEFAVTRN